MMKLGFICNGIVRRRLSSSLSGLRLLPLLYSTSTSTSPIDSGNNANHSSFAEFLVTSLGFDVNQSIAASARFAKRRGGSSEVSELNFVDNALSVVHFFKQLGFQNSQIKSLVAAEPRYLMSGVDNSLKPKIKLLKQLGVSDSDLVDMILANNQLLRIRLEPVIEAFKTAMGSDEYVVLCLKKQSYLGGFAYLVPNVQLLRNSCNASVEKIRRFILQAPRNFLVRTDHLSEIVVKVEHKLGIPRYSTMFLYGVRLLICQTEENLEKKIAVFKSYGWTQSHISVLMRAHPLCFASSESMIKRRLDFLMNEVGYMPDEMMKRVSLFTYSLEKRLMPRYRIVQILSQKGKANCSLTSASCLTESAFVKRFVLPFEEVHQVYAQLTGSTAGSLNLGRAKKGQS